MQKQRAFIAKFNEEKYLFSYSHKLPVNADGLQLLKLSVVLLFSFVFVHVFFNPE